MENFVGDIIKLLVTAYILYLFILSFLITTFVYFTYRFWKFILPKEESEVFITNAPVIGHIYDEDWTEK